MICEKAAFFHSSFSVYLLIITRKAHKKQLRLPRNHMDSTAQQGQRTKKLEKGLGFTQVRRHTADERGRFTV